VCGAAECCVRVSSTSPVSVKSPSPFQSSLSLAQLPVWLSVHCWSRHDVEMLDPFQCSSCVLVKRLRLCYRTVGIFAPLPCPWPTRRRPPAKMFTLTPFLGHAIRTPPLIGFLILEYVLDRASHFHTRNSDFQRGRPPSQDIHKTDIDACGIAQSSGYQQR